MNERLKTLYKQTVAPKLLDQFQYKNAYQIPKLKKLLLIVDLDQLKIRIFWKIH